MAINIPPSYYGNQDPSQGFAGSYINALASSVANRAPQPFGAQPSQPLSFGLPEYQASPLPMQANALSFGERLGQSESGGNYGSVNTLGYTGKYQFGEARLTDFNRANGTKYTLADLKKNPGLQERAFQWHIADIDKAIDRNGLADSGYSRDSLRAVAHLGGVGGMIKFAKSGGSYNPSDDYGTSLSEYAAKFR